MKKKNRFLFKQGLKYFIMILMAVGLILFYSLITSLSTTNQVIVFSTIVGLVLVALIIDLISYKDLLGLFGK